MGALIRDTLGELLLSKLSDPRIDPALTSIVRVEVTEDYLQARVFITVIGDDARQRKTVTALQHAAGHLQEMMMERISLRHTPKLDFVLDKQFKKTLRTLEILQEISHELHEADAAAAETSPPAEDAAEDAAQG